MIEVTYIETGITKTMTRKQFNKLMGGYDNAQEVLAGCFPHIVAVEV